MHLIKYIFSYDVHLNIKNKRNNRNHRVLSSDIPATELCPPMLCPFFLGPTAGGIGSTDLQHLCQHQNPEVNFPGLRGI